MSLPNIWHHRRVADNASKACFVCYKPSTNVLITPDSKDFFYICPIHLKDRGFCSPIVDAEQVAKKKKEEELAKEIEKVKQEYEEKQKLKREKEKEKEKEKKKEKDGKEKNQEKDQKKSDTKVDDLEKEKEQKIDALKKSSAGSADDSPRIYALNKNFYQMRITRLKNLEISKRNMERLKNPAAFPSTPKGDL